MPHHHQLKVSSISERIFSFFKEDIHVEVRSIIRIVEDGGENERKQDMHILQRERENLPFYTQNPVCKCYVVRVSERLSSRTKTFGGGKS